MFSVQCEVLSVRVTTCSVQFDISSVKVQCLVYFCLLCVQSLVYSVQCLRCSVHCSMIRRHKDQDSMCSIHRGLSNHWGGTIHVTAGSPDNYLPGRRMKKCTHMATEITAITCQTPNSTFEEKGQFTLNSEKEVNWLSIQRKRQKFY